MLSKILRKELICLDIKSRDKLGAMKEMLEMLEEAGQPRARIRLLQNLIHRESLESTALGEGVALPHCRTNLVDFPIVLLGRSKEGVDFEAPDGRPVHLIIMALIPQTSTVPWLQLMREIAEMVRDKRFMDSIASAKSSEEVLELIAEMERRLLC